MPVQLGKVRKDGDAIDCDLWLKEFLINGPRPSSEVFTIGLTNGFSKRTIYRARKRLRIEARLSCGTEKGWWVQLPK